MAIEAAPEAGQLPSRPVTDGADKYRAARFVAIVAGLLGAVLRLSPHCCRSSRPPPS